MNNNSKSETEEGLFILLVHGHMGRRAQFDFLCRIMDEKGIPCRSLCLPGHEGTVGDFARSTSAQWREAYRQALCGLSAAGKVMVVTHSMGGLLAIDHAIAHPDEAPEEIIALCLPLAVRLTPLGIKSRLLSVFPQRKGEDVRITAAREMCGVSGITPLNSICLVPNTLALLRMIRKTKKAVRKLTVPMTVINSLSDDIVSPRSVALAEKSGAVKKSILLEKSSHFWFSEEEKKSIADIAVSEYYSMT